MVPGGPFWTLRITIQGNKIIAVICDRHVVRSQPEPVPGPGPESGLGPGHGPEEVPPEPIPTEPAAAGRKLVELAFSADRDQLYTAWNALANLADMAGEVSVSVQAESEEGFDPGKLENGVMEPLREADLIE